MPTDAPIAAIQQASSTRLHITPFNQALFSSYLSSDLQSKATNISYHAVQTYPDKGFGYLDLPTADALKLKQKLNGATLKGQKIRIEEARTEKRKLYQEEREAMAVTAEIEEPVRKKAKKQKDQQGVLNGVELEDDRKVKRGWTESVAEKKEKKAKSKGGKPAMQEPEKDKKGKSKIREASKFSSESELLFKTKLPPNVAANQNSSLKSSKKSKKAKKDGDKDDKDRNVVVHEFEHTTKHANFLRSGKIDADAKGTKEFVDGKGWINEEGDVVEPEPEGVKKRKKRKADALVEQNEIVGAKETAMNEASKKSADTKPAATPDVQASKRKRVSFAAETSQRSPKVASSVESDTSSNDVSSSDVSSDSEPSDSDSDSSDAEGDPTAESPNPPRTSLVLSQEAADPNAVSTDLVDMYKRSKTNGNTKALAIDTSFSFFGGAGSDIVDDDDDGDDSEIRTTVLTTGGSEEDCENPPLTPFTQRDRWSRGIRSAAPTPDTTTAHRRFSFPAILPGTQEEEDEDEDEDDSDESDEDMAEVPALDVASEGPIIPRQTPAIKTLDSTEPAELQPYTSSRANESEFAKWFWENRGDNNRAWKKRRREVMKMKRAGENRRVSRRVI